MPHLAKTAFVIPSILWASAALGGITVEPAAWQSTSSGVVVPADRRVTMPGQWSVEAPGAQAAPPQYWKVVETPPRPVADAAVRIPRGGGARAPVMSQQPVNGVRFYRSSIGGLDVWVRIPALFLTLPTFKVALPDPLGQAGRPPTLGNVGDGKVRGIGPPRSAEVDLQRTPYGRSMAKLYPYVARTPDQWAQEREKVISAPTEQRVGATQQLLREAGLTKQVRKNLQPRTYSTRRWIPQSFTGINPVTQLHELDPQLIEDDSQAGRAAKEANRVAGLAGLERAEVLIQQGDRAGAQAELQATTGLNPEDGVAWGASAAVLILTGDDAEAVRAFARAIELSPAFSKIDFAKWGWSNVGVSDATTRLMGLAKRNSGAFAADALMLAATRRAWQGNQGVAQRLLDQAKVREPGAERERVALAIASEWGLTGVSSTGIGNLRAKPASKESE
jgi:hypothetical protein